ncbi:Fe-S oxidoreductase [Deltaproteobacteria bacterium Smac51]|nr:Fe-S oxidoreductase [Deltaproteobacteria bacterium Smac51]
MDTMGVSKCGRAVVLTSVNLAERIKAAALRLNYEKCGLIRLSEMDEYADKVRQRLDRFSDGRPVLEPVLEAAGIRERFPWAKSVIICTRRYDNYKMPPTLNGRFSKYYLFDARRNQRARDYQDGLAFEQFLRDSSLRFAGGERGDLVMPGNRWAAMKAGLGVLRRNNFFYTENGSWLFLESWLIDRELELKEESKAKPCPKNCVKCLTACPTNALPESYVFDLTSCVSYLTRRGGWDLTADSRASSIGQWLYGCDVCQDVCPLNQRPWVGKDDFPGAAELAVIAAPEDIVRMGYEDLKLELFKRFWSIPEDKLWKWKINALNAMKNDFDDQYRPAVEAALNDEAEPVRHMARWVLRSEGRQR